MTPSEFFARHFPQIIFDLFPDSFYSKVLLNAPRSRAQCGTSPASSPPPPPVFKTDLGVNVSIVRKFFSGNPYSRNSDVAKELGISFGSFGITEPEIAPTQISLDMTLEIRS